MNKLDLYRLAVQHPRAEAAFLARVFEHHRRHTPLLLKEDFAGTAALAAAWVASHPDRQAVAVERHAATWRWAVRHAAAELNDRAGDLHLVHADVHDVTAPRVDVVAALNFSAFICHDRASLLRYLRAARRSLRPGGAFVMDLFGGPGAMRVGVQRRRIVPPKDEHAQPFEHPFEYPFEYQWEQRAFDAATGRIDCRIHFVFPGGRMIRDAFRYDWRLWSPPEILDTLREAGFPRTALWCDGYDPRTKRSNGAYHPIKHIDSREDWIAYAVGLR